MQESFKRKERGHLPPRNCFKKSTPGPVGKTRKKENREGKFKRPGIYSQKDKFCDNRSWSSVKYERNRT